MTGNSLTALDFTSTHQAFSTASEADQTLRVERVLKSHKHGFSTGKTLVLEGDQSQATFCVLDGWLALSKSTKEGQRQIIDFALPGDIVNPAWANKKTSALQIETLSYAKVSIMPTIVWENLLDRVPVLQARENQMIASALSRMSERMLRLGKGTAEMRIAYSLIELFLRLQVIGRVADARFHIPLTQNQLGEFAGLSSVHVCRTMRCLCRKGILIADGQMDITIHDLEGLAEIAGVELGILKAEIIPTH